MEIRHYGNTNIGTPILVVATGLIGAFAIKTENLLDEVKPLVGANQYAILLHSGMMKMSKRRLHAILAHEDGHIVNGHLDHPEGSLPMINGIIVVPQFELEADAYAAKATSSRAMRGALCWLQGAIWAGAFVSWCKRNCTWLEMRKVQKAVKSELQPRLKALRALKV